MEITVIEVMLTPENRIEVRDFLRDYSEDVRFKLVRNYPSEEVFREIHGFGKWWPTYTNKEELPADRGKIVEARLRNLEKIVPGLRILPFGPFQAYELKGKYGNPDRPEIEGFAIVFTNQEVNGSKDEHTQTE